MITINDGTSARYPIRAQIEATTYPARIPMIKGISFPKMKISS